MKNEHDLFDAPDLAVHAQRLQVQVGRVEDRAGRRFVDAARLEADEAVLDDVDAADAVPAGRPVQVLENGQRIRQHLVRVLVHHFDRKT